MKEDFDILVKALIKERDKFLEEHPELKEYQKQIDRELDKVGTDPLARAQKMNELLMKKMNEELLPAMAELRKMKKKARGLEKTITHFKKLKNKEPA